MPGQPIENTGSGWGCGTDDAGAGGVTTGTKGDINVISADSEWRVVPDAVSNAKLANMTTSTIKGRITTGTGDPEDLDTLQLTSLVNQFTDTLKGVVPGSGGGTTKLLRADGTWAAPPGRAGVTSFNGRFGAVAPASGDYTATLVTSTATNVAATTVQGAIAELDTEKQSADGDLIESRPRTAATTRF